MEAADPFEQFVRTGLERLGFTPDDVDVAVLRATDSVYGGQIEALMDADLDGDVELDLDLSREPRPS